MPASFHPTSAPAVGFERPVQKGLIVDLLDVLELLFRHLTPTLCETVYNQVRTTERERKWSLEAIARFWTAMIVRNPPSLTHGIAQTRKRGNRDTLWPRVQAEVNAFFEKCWALRADFFRTLYETFTQSILQEAPATYASWLRPLREHFPEILVVDGSRLDAVCHRLKFLWSVREAILPGCVTVFYDVFRGVSRRVLFYPHALEGELPRAQGEMDWIAPGSLIVGDRLYSAPQYFHRLAEMGLDLLTRRSKHLIVRRLRVLHSTQHGRNLLEDILVEVGCAALSPRLTLRLIRSRCPQRQLDLLTTVLDPKKLSAEQAVGLYGLRWSVERMFLDLKKTLKLHSLYASHPNLVAQQVYATAMVYNAFRVAQARIALRAEVLPEQISPEKLFPILAASSNEWAISQRTMIAVRESNPGVRLKEPDWRKMDFASVELAQIRLQRRETYRRKRRFCVFAGRWRSRSFAHVPGGPKLLASLTDG